MKKIRVIIADDHAIVREGTRRVLEAEEDIEVVGEAANGTEALDKVKRLKPNVVLMDIAMPIMGGLEATRRIRRESPEARVLILTQYDDREYVFPILEAGAVGFISKAAASSELVSGIRAVYHGHSFLSPPVAKLLVEDYQRGGERTGLDPYEQLTDRERDVLKLVAEGFTTHEIADLLKVTPKTVEGHKTNLMAKLDIHNRIELVKYALRKGIISI